MPTLGNGEQQALIQGLKGALLREMVGYAGQTSGTLEQVADGNGLVNYTLGMDGTVTATKFVGTGAQTFSGNLVGYTIPLINANAATLTLTAAQSGSLVNFNRASGVVVTLPAPVVGLTYYFNALVSVTSNNYEIDTDAGTTFIMGGVRIASSTTAGDFFANGTSHVKIQMNGTTKGGLIGSAFGMTCISATQWTILPGALISGSGTAASPFA